MAQVLTDALLKGIKPPADGRLELVDLRATGLCFRVTAAGARSWSYRFRDPESGKLTRATIGPYPEITLSTARERATDYRRMVASGKNPVEAKRQERSEATSKTFGALATRYMREHSERKKRSTGEDDRNLRLHVLPKWQSKRFDRIQRADVIELVEGIVSSGKGPLANKVQALVSSIFSFAVDADLLGANPCLRLRKRGVERAGRRVLADDEIRVFWSGVTQSPVSPRVGLALRLLLLTGQRAGEVAGLSRAELEHLNDAKRAAWILPPERSKNKRAHYLPLSPAARDVVRAALDLIDDGEQFLFPSPRRDGKEPQPITAHALAVAMARFTERLEGDAPGIETWKAEPPTPHDLRRTVATRLAELRIAQEDRDAVLNHAPQGVGKRHYDLYDRAAEKRAALIVWGDTLSGILRGRSRPALVAVARQRSTRKVSSRKRVAR